MDSVARILELIVDFLKRNYKKPKLWFAILGILVFIILIFPYIDSNTFYYTRMEKRISILEHLTQLDETTINSNPVYRQEYESILQEIQLQRERSVNSIATQLFDTVNSSWTTGKDQGNKILKFISGAIWFLIVTICVPFMNTFKKRSDKLVAFIVMIILSTIVGCIFMAIPIIYRSWINYFVIPIAQLVIVIVLVGKKDKKS
ncbi:MAG: hypothetical protein MR442_11050 [Lachnospiraceae bacterium]|jgi:hypothetical protein|nr:hypothetical protein [Lachnospiraceae bacterium]